MCGVFGIRSEDRDVARLSYFGLFALQHRGQESAGIAVSDKGRLTVVRDMGLVAQVFNEQQLHALPGEVAIGHTRYSTTGANRWANAQPLVHHGRARTVALGHNGNLVNVEELRAELEADGVRLGSGSDTEVIAALLGRDPAPLPEAMANTMGRLEGAYSVTALAEGILLAFRDPFGFRPLSLGLIGDDWVVASETCALDLMEAKVERDIEPGELLVIGHDGPRSVRAFPPGEKLQCVFEYVYFARPDSALWGRNVHTVRKALGHQLAREHPVPADIVIPVPDSGTSAALGYSEESGTPYEMGLIRNHYVGRTFIEPKQGIRHFGVKVKLNPMPEMLQGKRVVVVDDSIVRGTTSRKIVRMLRNAGAREVHMRISSPPIQWPCYYGIDTPTRKELIGSSHNVEEIRRYLGADSLGYLSLDGMLKATGSDPAGFCHACFTGAYKVGIEPEPTPQLHLFDV